eukprot:4789878-Alexandrium_andersonii.AAC.1
MPAMLTAPCKSAKLATRLSRSCFAVPMAASSGTAFSSARAENNMGEDIVLKWPSMTSPRTCSSLQHSALTLSGLPALSATC